MTRHKNYGFILFATILVAIGAMLFAIQVQGASLFQPSEDSLIRQLENETAGEVRISYHRETEQVRFIGTTTEQPVTMNESIRTGSSPDTVSRAFLSEYGALFGLQDPKQELLLKAERSLDDGRSFVRYQQVHENVPVIGGELVVQTDADLSVISANGEVLPALSLDVNPRLSAEAATETAVAKVAKDYDLDASQLVASEPVLSIYNAAMLGGPGPLFDALVWQTEVTAVDMQPINEYVLVDAQLGAIALHFSQIHSAKNRVIHDNNNNPALGLPGNGPVRTEGQGPTGTTDVDLAYDYSGDTYDFFWNEHGRDSLDNAGLTLLSTTRYCPSAASCPYANAFWNGTQMVYGAGFPAADDVVGHELTHGVTDFSSQLFYFYQSGAINESLSDVWGEFVDLTNGAGNDTPGVRWQMGEDVPGSGAIRDMKNPPAFNDPDRILSPIYYCSESDLASGAGDNGGVHINSGVNNKAAYLMTDGDTFNGKTVTGMGIFRVADLYYEVQTNMLTSASDYNDLYDLLIQASINLGFSASDQQAVKDAVDAVEMNQLPTGCPVPKAPVCDSGSPQHIFFDDIESGSGNWTAGSNQGTIYWFVPQTTETLGLNGPYATSGVGNIWGFNQGAGIGSTSDTYLAMNSNVALPANAYMHFNHSFGFESVATFRYDGGILEYSTNSGASWTDAGSLFTHNGYNGILDGAGNPLGAIPAFSADSRGYISSRLDLSSLAGQNVRFRFRIGTDSIVYDYGWFIDDVGIYTCETATATPTATATGIATATATATATPDPTAKYYAYLPLIIYQTPPPQIKPGYWSGFGTEFYVAHDSQQVLEFAIDINVDGCGQYKIAHTVAENISNKHFSFTGPFYASGTFNSQSTAGGQLGLNNFSIPGCGSVTGGPFNWSTEWQNASQPTLTLDATDGLDSINQSLYSISQFSITKPVK